MLAIVLFFYGLFFFTLGVVVFSSSPKESSFFFAKKIWLLGMFGFTHAFVEWISLYYHLYPSAKSYLLFYEIFLLFLSYLFLFEFSRFMLRSVFTTTQTRARIIYELFAPAVIYSLFFSVFIVMVILDPKLNEIIVAIRYTFGFWGSLFLGIGLYMYAKTLKKLNHAKDLRYYFKTGGIVFVAYAFFSGFIVPPVNHFPANIINTHTFLEFVGVPVYVFRSICAFIIAIISTKALKIFEYEIIEELTESSRQIQEFSANASHQLKTPLSSIQLQIEVTLKKERSVAEYKNVLVTIKKEVETLQNLSITLLMLAKVRNFEAKSSFEKLEVDSIVLDILVEYMPIAKSEGVFVHVESLDATSFYGDKELIRILIANLLDNAIKYTPKNRTVNILLKPNQLKIRDEGKSIPKNKHKFIFDKYYQLDKKHYNTKSFGLGLPLAKKIANIHNIKINLENNKDIGNTFSVYF